MPTAECTELYSTIKFPCNGGITTIEVPGHLAITHICAVYHKSTDTFLISFYGGIHEDIIRHPLGRKIIKEGDQLDIITISTNKTFNVGN